VTGGRVSTIPTWQAAAVGYGENSGLVGQFLGAHNSVWLYSGAQVVSQQAIGTGVFQSTQSLWLSQQITTGAGQTSIPSVGLQLSTVGGSPTSNLIPPITLGLYADSGGVPAGPALAKVTVSCMYVYGQPFWAVFPLGASGLTAGTVYHLVTNLVGTAGHYYAWQQSTAGTGAATSPDGTTWTGQPFGLMYQVYGPGGTGLLQTITEDNGAQLTTLSYDSLNRLTGIQVSVLGQDGNFITSSGTLAWSNGLVTGVS
jgi:hypothetical protein